MRVTCVLCVCARSDIYQREVEAFQERFAPVEGVAREAPMTPEELGKERARERCPHASPAWRGYS